MVLVVVFSLINWCDKIVALKQLGSLRRVTVKIKMRKTNVTSFDGKACVLLHFNFNSVYEFVVFLYQVFSRIKWYTEEVSNKLHLLWQIWEFITTYSKKRGKNELRYLRKIAVCLFNSGTFQNISQFER